MNANSRYRSTGEPQLDKAVQRWLRWDKVSLLPGTRAGVCARSRLVRSERQQLHPELLHLRPN